MPFLEHFGLETYPFALTPNLDLYYSSPETENILSALLFALRRGDGLIKIVGEVGTGKTLLCRLLLTRLGDEPFNTAYVNAPVGLNAESLPSLILKEFKIKTKSREPDAVRLRDFLLKEHAAGRRNVLIVDEAQALGAPGLEAIRLLTNLETETDKLLQIVLFGQPELDRLLHQHDLRQVLQRIGFGFVMKPFPKERVDSYLRFRIERSMPSHSPKGKRKIKQKKASPEVSFSAEAALLIAKASGGLPRLIHLLADKALMAAYAKGTRLVEKKHVKTACQETEGLAWYWRWV